MHLDHFLKWACNWGYNSIVEVLALQIGNPPEKARYGATTCNTSVEEASLGLSASQGEILSQNTR